MKRYFCTQFFIFFMLTISKSNVYHLSAKKNPIDTIRYENPSKVNSLNLERFCDPIDRKKKGNSSSSFELNQSDPTDET